MIWWLLPVMLIGVIAARTLTARRQKKARLKSDYWNR
jgi:hypothetical protein